MVELEEGECANCNEHRLLKYARRTMCCKYACQQAAAALCRQRRAGRRGGEDAEDPNDDKEPSFCVEIRKVYGVRDIDSARLTGKKRRNTVLSAEYTISYLLLGRFAEDDEEQGFWDTRWVDLVDLVANLDKKSLKPLAAYEKQLAKRMATARQRYAELAA